MVTYIIADLHLSENKPLLLNALANFYDKTLILNDRLIILGDMFDVFVGLDPKSAFHQKIRAIISKAHARGVTTLFQRGNRDFLVDSKAADYFCMTLISDFYAIPTVNGNALLMHGDQLCAQDRSYQNFKRFSNNPLVKAVFMCLPLSTRENIGNKIRNKSENRESRNDLERHLNNPNVKKLGRMFLEKAKCKLLIHGHFHVYGGEDNAFGEGTYRLGLGMWDSNFSYIKIDRNELKLVQRKMEKNF